MEIDPRTHVGSVALRVRNADTVARLYEGAVGLSRLPEQGNGDRRVELSADGERPLIVLAEVPHAPLPPRRSAGLFHTAIRFSTRSQLADALRRVTQAGFRLTGASDHGVSEALYLDDPEGNGVELYWDRPRGDWPTTEDGGIAMFTAPLDVRGLLEEAQGSEVDSGADVGHAHLKVTDLPRAVGFWRDALGLDLKVMYGQQAAFLAAGDYHHHIGANIWESGGGAPAPEDALGLERVTLALPDADALSATVEGVRGAGAEVSESGAGALVRDPDGILVELSVL
jgi:catechol 2,3-dioxygenase